MSCTPCNPCAPVQFCQPENFGLAFPSLVGPMGPPGGPGLYVENYAALRALDPTTYPAGYVANVGGYDSVNDGGGGAFVYVPSGTDADNDGTILTPSNNVGRWYRVYSGAVNVQWFGATGDGTTNDFQAIQNAITYIESLTTGGAIFLPAGNYLTNGQLDFSGNRPVFFFGEGEGSTTVTGDGVGIVLHLGIGSGDRTTDLRISSMSIVGINSADIGIQLDRIHQILVDRVKVTDFVTAGFDLNMAYNNEIRDVWVQDCGTGILVDADNEYTLITRAKVYSCDAVGIHFRNGSCSGSKIMFADIEACEVGIKIDCGSAENLESFGVVGCYFKDMVDANCQFGTDASSLWIDSLLFQNNEVKAGTAGPATNVVEFDRCRKPILMSNTFHSADVTVTGNTSGLVDLGNTYDASAEPTAFLFGNPNDNLAGELPTSDPAVPNEWWQDASGFMHTSL